MGTDSKRGVLLGKNGAHDRSRTCTPLLGLEPESSASANSATWAGVGAFGLREFDLGSNPILPVLG